MLLLRAFLLFLGVVCGLRKVEACAANNLTDNLVTLLQTAFLNNAPQGAENPVVTILQHQVVCLTTTTTRGTYSSASVIVSFTCTGGIACPGTGDLQQFEFTCGSSSSNMWSPTTFAVPSSGSLTTPLRTDCGLCVETAAGLMDRFDNATHCVACSSLCSVGLMECTGTMDTDCCNGVVNDMCVENCTTPARPLDSANYECTVFCDPLSNPDNGAIMFSSGNSVDSVATYVCDANFAVQGGVNRTCELSGSVTAWSATAPSCVRVATEEPTQDATTGIRNTMTPSPETADDNTLGVGAIIGIVIAVIIVLLIVAVVIIAVIFLARK